MLGEEGGEGGVATFVSVVGTSVKVEGGDGDMNEGEGDKLKEGEGWLDGSFCGLQISNERELGSLNVLYFLYRNILCH